MMTLETLMTVLGSSFVTALAQWALYFRRHAAEAKSVVKSNDKQEIENLSLVAKEWREAAQIWKQMADEYQKKGIEDMRRIDELEKKVSELESALAKANKQIDILKKHETHR